MKLLLPVVVSVYLVFSYCMTGPPVSAPQNTAAPSATPASENKEKEEIPVVRAPGDEKTILKRRFENIDILWTNRDLYNVSDSQKTPVFSTFALDDFKKAQGGTEARFENNHSFKLLAVVGNILSFEHENIVFYGSPAIVWRYTTVDLSKNGDFTYPDDLNSEEEVFYKLSDTKVTSLLEYFEEADLVEALKNEPAIKKQLGEAGAGISTLKDLYKIIEEKGIYWEQREFELTPDFITRFSFYSVAANKAAVRISLTHRFSYNRGLQRHIVLNLPVPPKMQAALKDGGSRRNGFLMSDSDRLFGKAETKIELSNKD